MKIVVDVEWDAEARVWYAMARGNVGLATEHGSLDGLRDRMLAVLPDLLYVEDSVAFDLEMVVQVQRIPNPTAAE